MRDERSGATAPDVNGQLVTLTDAVNELREGQDELLKMYGELRELYPANCLCADARAEAARREFLAQDVLGNPTAYEEYRP